MAELDLGSVVGPQGQQGIQGQTGPQGPAGPGVPTGGTDGQFLLKDGSTNYETKWGTVTGADLDVSGVDSTKISAALTSTNQAIANVQNGLAYIVGNTNATGSTLTVGQFVYVKGHSTIAEGLREVTASISANGNITTSNTSACSDGGLNALNSNISKVKDATDIGNQSTLSGLQSALSTIASSMAQLESRLIKVYIATAFETFRSSNSYIGYLFVNRNNGTRIDFTVTFEGPDGDSITISRNNGVWAYTDMNEHIANDMFYIKEWSIENVAVPAQTATNSSKAISISNYHPIGIYGFKSSESNCVPINISISTDGTTVYFEVKNYSTAAKTTNLTVRVAYVKGSSVGVLT